MDHFLLVFVTVVEKGNFSHAAHELHMTQSAVSQNVKSLESKYGAKLFERTNKYVKLTQAGEIFYQHAKNILGQYAHLERLIDDLSNKAKGPLSIGSGFTFGEYILPNTISLFKEKYPQIVPKITIKNSKRIANQIQKHELDIGIVDGEVIDHPNICSTIFAKDEMVIIVPSNHQFAEKRDIDMIDLKNETWIIREEGSGTREVTNRLFLKSNFFPESFMEFGSSQLIKGAVESGLGISLISKCAIKREISDKSIAYVNVRDYEVNRDISLLTQSSQFHTKATDLFIAFLTLTVPVTTRKILFHTMFHED